jgi:hypothetical protein
MSKKSGESCRLCNSITISPLSSGLRFVIDYPGETSPSQYDVVDPQVVGNKLFFLGEPGHQSKPERFACALGE